MVLLDLRRKLADTCNAPLGTEEEVKVHIDSELKAVKSAAKAFSAAILSILSSTPSLAVAKIKNQYHSVSLAHSSLANSSVGVCSIVIMISSSAGGIGGSGSSSLR